MKTGIYTIGFMCRQPSSEDILLTMKVNSHRDYTGEAQSPLTIDVPAKIACERRIQTVQYWVLEHLQFEHSVHALAARAGMSVRHFTRVFQRETSSTPVGFIVSARMSVARRLLENADLPLKCVAKYSGFINTNVMRAAFTRSIGVSPRLYRAQKRSMKTLNGGEAA